MGLSWHSYQSLFFAILAFFSFSNSSSAQLAVLKRPKLVLVLVIDQFRADQIARFRNRFMKSEPKKGQLGGFNYLLEHAAYFPYAEYGLLQNMTGPGHATILSGAYAYQHGIALNEWIDEGTGKLQYCVEDPAYPLIAAVDGQNRQGISPRNFRGSTFGDELKNSGYRSQVISLAIKDRAAVLLGGYRADLAIWYDVATRAWISSKFYLPESELPAWVQTLNKKIAQEKDQSLEWSLSPGLGSGTSLPNNNFIVPSKAVESLGREFPHRALAGSKFSLMLPYGTQMTADAAIAALTELKLGRGPDPDVLAVSFSNHDFLSHSYGPNSRELEELTVAEDREIARIFSKLDQELGIENTLIVLTADHGAPPNPDWLKSVKVSAGRIDDKKLLAAGEDFLQKTYVSPHQGQWLTQVFEFNFYLDHKNIKAAALDIESVEESLAKFYRESPELMEGIAEVITAAQVRSGRLPGVLFERLIRKTFVAGRSGDIIMIPRPNYILPGETTNHLSGYAYDRMVPLLIAGPQIRAGIYAQKAEIIDIAPTLSFLTGTTPPSGSEGRVLHEILGLPPLTQR
ncbi:MAG: alkaline phosphatase family protein [Proteobacteria bacterium]|nr:alkaline phosphatase family protein [Pseudomonadota bacterium]